MINRFQDNAANERTFLSWIRSAVTIAGFGIIIEKLPGGPNAVMVGYVLVGASALLVLLSTARFLAVRKQLRSAETDDSAFTQTETIFTLMLAALIVTILMFLLHSVV
jgi:putative membrane protein